MTSFAKYNPNSSISGFPNNRRDSRNSLSSSSSAAFHPRRRIRKGFFIKPHLRITGIKSYPHKIPYHIAGKVEEYDCMVWTLKIQNKYGKISRNVNNCAAKIYFHVIQKELPLRWKSSMEVYWNKDFYPESNETPNTFFARVGATCVFNLHRLGLEAIDIPPSKENEIYFLVTFRDIQLPYLVLRGNSSENVLYDGHPILMPRQDGVDLVLRYHEEFEFQIRFEGESYYEEKGITSKIKINSWNDIKLK